MKKYFKVILYFIGSIIFLIFTIMFAIVAVDQFSWLDSFTIAYYIAYMIALSFVTVLFAIKGIEHLINDTSLRDKLAARRQARTTAKAEKAEADKQARIKNLETELEELKKDE